MKDNAKYDADVLIVGAGPTGVSLACALKRVGVDVLLIDKEAPVGQARAMGLSARTLEVLRAFGIVDEFLKEAVIFRTMDIYANRRRILHMTFDVSNLSSPNPFGAVLPQNRVVALLEKHLHQLGGHVSRPIVLKDLTQDKSGVAATLDENGSVRDVRVRYVVGCDGAHSKVRELLGLEFDGSDYEDRLLAADVFVDWDLPAHGGHILLGSTGTITAFPFPEPGKWRLAVFGGNDVRDRGPDAVMARLRELMIECGPKGARIHDPIHTTYYGIHRRVVHHFRLGRCFVAGDAAHIHSPAGGQGMNTGIQDGFNLAWKLSLVLNGRASEKLLDTYQQERRPVAQEILKATDRLTQIILPRSPWKLALRDSFVKILGSIGPMGQNVGRTLSQLKIKYSNSSIVSEGTASSSNKTHRLAFALSPNAGERAPDCALDQRSRRPESRLFDLIYRQDALYTLLLFDGLQPTESGPVISGIVSSLQSGRADQLFIVRISWPGFREASKASGHAVVLDPDGTIHRKYGAIGACIYLIRPDGYIGYRSQPPSEPELISYLERLN